MTTVAASTGGGHGTPTDGKIVAVDDEFDDSGAEELVEWDRRCDDGLQAKETAAVFLFEEDP